MAKRIEVVPRHARRPHYGQGVFFVTKQDKTEQVIMSLKAIISNTKKFIPATVVDFLFALKKTFMALPYATSLIKTLQFFIAFRKDSLRREPLMKLKYSGISFGIRPIEWYTMESVILGREYNAIQFLFSDKGPKTIVDAGANIGLFSVYAFSLWADTTIYSIEAGAETYALLQQNKARNPAYAWHVENYALWDEDGHVHFKDEGFSYGWRVSNQNDGVRIPSVRLDSFIDRHIPGGSVISLLKIDIEGAEEKVLLSSQHILHRVEAVVVEVHPPTSDKDEVMNILRKNFKYIYDISMPDADQPELSLLLACNKKLPEDKFSALS